MSRLAMDQITITDVTDGEKGVSVKIVTPFYALGTAAPDKPTVNPPASVWTTTEPEYVKGKNLYTTQRTVLEDFTFSYSDVSLDSSYKASEKAIATADTANTTAGEAKTTAGEAKTTSGEAKTIATEAKTASTTNKNNLDSEIEARNQAIANLKTSIDSDIEVVSQKAADAQKAGDDAANDLTTFRTSTESQLTSINGLVGGVRTDVNAVSNKAATLASGLDSANTKITSTSDNLTGLTNTVSNISKTADDSMALSTTNHQDLAGFKTTVQQTYSTKEDTLNQVTTVNQKADALSATLSKDYQKKADSDAKYSTKAELTATSNSITASVAEIYATKSVVEALKNIADKAIETWQGPGAPTLTNLPASDWNTADLKKQHSGDVYYDTDSGFAYRFGSADGTTYKWGRISDSDITKALNLASKAQETADGAVAGVTKLNTDIPVTYATKSDVKITTDGIKADVVEAKRIGQTGVNNAAALAIRADGIDAMLSQQATNIDKNVKSITQLGLRADGISTSVSQVDAKVDQALANAQELVVNGGFETGDATGWSINKTYQIVDDMSGSHSGRYYLNAGSATEIVQPISVPVIPGHIYRFSGWYRRPSTNSSIIGGIRFQKSSDGKTYNDWQMTEFGKSKQDDWTYFSIDGTIPSDGSVKYARYRLAFADTTGVVQHFDDLSFKDITEAAAALSKATTAQQNLDGFKTQVTQTYETKEASASKATTAQQNLEGFKTSVSSTYATKIALDTTNGNVTQAQATGDQAIFAALPSLADKTQANSWLCSIFPTGKGSVETLPSYSLIASLAASDTKYSADSGDILNGNGIDYHYGLIRTLVSFAADTKWTFTYSHDDGSRIYVDGTLVFERAQYAENDSVTINFTKGNHIVDIMYSNGIGGYGVWGFSVALSSIATTMYAPAGASVLATALDKAQKDATSALSQYSTLSQDVNGFKTSVSQTYTKQSDTNALQKTSAITYGFSTPGNRINYWYRIGTVKNGYQGRVTRLDIDISKGNNGDESQNARMTLLAHRGWDGGGIARAFGVSFTSENWPDPKIMAIALDQNTCEIWMFDNMSGYLAGNYTVSGYRDSWTNNPVVQDDTPSGTQQQVGERLNPEDLKSEVVATYATQSSVQQTATQITSQVETKYATKDALSQTDSKVDQKADEWSVQLSTVSSRADAITQTTDSISDQIANANSNINNVGSALSDEISSRKAYMSFNQDSDGDPVLSLGSSSSPNKVELSNDRLSFKSNDSEVAYIGDDQMNINNTNILKSLRLGNFMFLLRPDGHMVLTRATPELLTNTALLTNVKSWTLNTGASYVNSEQAIKVDGDKVIGSLTKVFAQYISDATVLYNRTMRVSVDLKRISGSGKTWRFEIIPGESWAMIVNTDDIPTDRYKTFTADISVASDKSIKQFACLPGAYAYGATGSFYARNMSIIDVTGI